MADYGYPRVSTPKQNLERQIRNIRKVCPNAILFPEKYTGSVSLDRQQWQRLMAVVKKGDTIYFDSVSRMSRNEDEGVEDYERLYNKGISLIFLNEPHLDTAVLDRAIANLIPMTGTDVDLILEGVNKYLMAYAKEQIRLGFEQAEKEVKDLRKRTKEGLVTARRNGKTLGRPAGRKYETQKSIRVKADIQKLSRNFGGTLSDADVIRLLQISRNTFYKYKREMWDGEIEKILEPTNDLVAREEHSNGQEN